MCCHRSKRLRGVAEIAAVLVAARDEESGITRTVESLRIAFPGAEVIVADDGSRDGTAEAAERAGARVLRLPARGKGQALTVGERAAPAGRLLLVDADLEGDLAKLAGADGDLAIAAFADRQGGGFGIAKRTGRMLVRALSGFSPSEPLSGQRALSRAARETCFPLAAGFGCEVRMTIDAVRRSRPAPAGRSPPRVATPRASHTAADSCSTRCSPAARRRSITAACGCRSWAGSSDCGATLR